MSPLLQTALADAAPLVATRGWVQPSDATLAEAGRLLALLAQHRAPTVLVEPDGAVQVGWDAADEGWLTLTVNGSGQLVHNAVIGEDEFEQAEAFADVLPAWAAELVSRLLRKGH